MMTTDQINGPLAAFLAGLVTSLHCVGMCGPIACIPCLRAGARQRLATAALYHAARVVSYTAVGTVVGGLGALGAGRILHPFTALAPWLLIGFFALLASGLDRKLATSALRHPISTRAMAKCAKWGTLPGAALLGLMTPFLPCGALYVMLGVALVSGSALQGGILWAAFALGIVPFFFALQAGIFQLGSTVQPFDLNTARRWLAAVSLVVVAARVVQPMISDGAAMICQ